MASAALSAVSPACFRLLFRPRAAAPYASVRYYKRLETALTKGNQLRSSNLLVSSTFTSHCPMA
jgi:hypothetical protein